MIRNTLARFLYGRYGRDQLNTFLLGVYLILYLISLLTGIRPLSWLAMAVLAAGLYRTLSKDFNRRRRENFLFLKWTSPVLDWLKLRRTIRRDKDHTYFKCPGCGQNLRVPKGKGKITVTCRNCGAVFQEKS